MQKRRTWLGVASPPVTPLFVAARGWSDEVTPAVSDRAAGLPLSRVDFWKVNG
jgi:hypothetical protein